MSGTDHFSSIAADYARHRPNYPSSLYRYLASLPGRRELAWDAGTGSGQAARQLAPWFHRVLATDISRGQLERAEGPSNVSFKLGECDSGLEAASVDLVTVAQALHWFDVGAFYSEVRRVLKPDGVIAVWCYQLLSITAQIDAVVRELYRDVLGPYWPAERRHVDEGYRGLPFPFDLVEPNRDWSIQVQWGFEDLMGYLGTWSALNRYRARTGDDPLRDYRSALQRAWGDAASRAVSWPLVVRIGRLSHHR